MECGAARRWCAPAVAHHSVSGIHVHAALMNERTRARSKLRREPSYPLSE